MISVAKMIVALICGITVSICLCSCEEKFNDTSSSSTSKKTLRQKDMNDILDGSYGEHPRNKFDIFFANSLTPTPLVIYIHGGGFTSGNKDQYPINEKERCLKNGISFATIEYPFISHKPLQEIMKDIARAVQYFKYNAYAFNIDKGKICCFGSSAGAGASLFLAAKPDLADKKNTDPVLRESSRIFAAGLYDTQSTYDFYKWPDILNLPIDQLFIAQAQMGNPLLNIYGKPVYQIKDFEKEEIKIIRKFLDMEKDITLGDPPLYIRSSVAADNNGDILHAQVFSQIIYDTCIETGIEAELYLPEMPSKHIDFSTFLLNKLS